MTDEIRTCEQCGTLVYARRPKGNKEVLGKIPVEYHCSRCGTVFIKWEDMDE